MSDTPPISHQAEAMLRRVSPEGRERAAREQAKRQRATMRLVGRCLLALVVIVLVTAAIGAWVAPVTPIGMIAALVAFVLACGGTARAGGAPARRNRSSARGDGTATARPRPTEPRRGCGAQPARGGIAQSD